jgi:hypothetical protein
LHEIRRLLQPIGNIPPAEDRYYAMLQDQKLVARLKPNSLRQTWGCSVLDEKRIKVLKWIGIFVASMLTGFYTVFVLQNLWNWFVVPSLDILPISYWTMFGVNMLRMVAISADSRHVATEEKWSALSGILNICIPNERKREVEEFIKLRSDAEKNRVFSFILKITLENTCALLFGWLVHQFIICGNSYNCIWMR